MSATARKLDYDDFDDRRDDHRLAEPEESIILFTEPEAPAPRAARRARPRLVPSTAPAVRRKRLGIFAVVCLGIVSVGLVAMLIVNTMLASGAFTISELEAQKAQLLEQEQQLQEEIAIASAPFLLEERARALGMVPQDAPAFISLETGEILGNTVPQPEPIVVDPATGTYVNGYLIDPTTGEIYIDPHTGMPITEDGQPIGYNGETVDGTATEDAILDPDTGEWVDPVTGQPIEDVVTDPTDGEASIGGDDGDISEEGGLPADPALPVDTMPGESASGGEAAALEGP